MRSKSEAAVSSSGVYTGDESGDDLVALALTLARDVNPEKRGCMVGKSVLGEGSVSTGGMEKPVVTGGQVAEVGGVGSCRVLTVGSKAGDWEGVSKRERWSSAEEGSHAEMEGRREWGAREEDLDEAWSSRCRFAASVEQREMGSLQRGQPVCSSWATLSVRSWR